MPQKFAVILAGGKGERFWPQSRLRRPKQLLPIVGDRPMLAQTVARVLPIVPAENIFIITNVEQAAAIRRICPEVPRDNIVSEPVGRDSGPAVGLAMELVAQRDPKGVFASLHADAAIHDVRAFQRDLRLALAAAAKAPVIVTIGVKPHEPATGYGYIQRAERWANAPRGEFYHVGRFVEKPSLEVAESYVSSGNFYWNTGLFVWSVPVLRAAFARLAPELETKLAELRAGLAAGRPLAPLLKKIFPTMPKISVDYALLEKADNVVVLPASFDWDDVGSWPAVARHHPKDAAGNTARGHVLVEEGRNNIMISEGGHLLAVIGADDLIVVHTADATLVCPRSRAQDIKKLLKRIEAEPSGKQWL